jgi:PAS domain S-box-containing protein
VTPGGPSAASVDAPLGPEQAVAALRVSEERLRYVAQAVTDAVWDWDLLTDEIWWSDSPDGLIGIAAGGSSPTGTQWKERIHHEDRDRVVQGIEAVIRGSGAEWSDEYRFRRADDSYAIVLDRGFVIRDPSGRPTRMVGGMSDITERRQLEGHVLRAQRLESIGTLAGGIAHDLNNMLSPILMSIDLLREHVASEEGRELLGTIEASAQRGANLVRQVLTFARGVDGQRAPLAPEAVVRDLARIVTDTFPKDIVLRTEVPADAWAIIGDATQVQQVLLNLAVNAIAAMPQGGTLTVSVRNTTLPEAAAAEFPDARPGTYVRLDVTDTGTGIPRRVLDRIFEPFFTTKQVGKGTGLGLSTAQAIARSHGGLIVVRSVEDEGTTFSVLLPADPTAREVRAPHRRASPALGLGRVILLVDDEPSIRHFAASLLERDGYRVITADCGEAAIAQFSARAREVALVITDMRMPGTDGRAVIRDVRRLAPGVPVIAMSGMELPVMVDKDLAGPPVLPLMKPFSGEQLTQAVLRAVIAR